MTSETKRCSKCRIEKSVSEFFTRKLGKGGYRSQCKRCHGGAESHTCVICGTVWEAFIGGRGRRNGGRCDDCYPYYRQATNLHAAAYQRSKQKNLEFDLVIEEIEAALKLPCPMTGVTLTILESGNDYSSRKPNSPSLDKIDPHKGYTRDNVQLVCWWYNVSKQQFSDEEVIRYCQLVTQNNQ